MGLFDAVSSVIKSVGGGSSGSSSGGGSTFADVLDIGSTVAGSYLSQKANKKAAKDVKKAEEERNDLIREQNQLVQQQFEEYRKLGVPASEYYRRILATEGGGLTPGQQQELDDVRRSTRSSLASSGLRGSGRATTAALRQVEGDVLGRFTQENRSRADRAARELSDQGFSATGQGAAFGANAAVREGEGLRTISAADAGKSLANARLQGQALGDITSLVASDIKDRTRKSRYAGTHSAT